MKILHINCVYACGSTGTIVENIARYCISKGDDVLILYGRHSNKAVNSNVIKVSSELEAKLHSVMSRLTGVDFGYSPLATKKTLRIIKNFKPDIVHLHCLNGHFINVFKLVDFLKHNEISTILTLHAEIMHTAGCEHAYECMKWVDCCYDCDRVKGSLTCLFRDDAKFAYRTMQRAFDDFKSLTIVGVSNWLTNRANQSAIFRHSNAKFITIENGLDLKFFHPIPQYDNPLKSRITSTKPIILHVTPNFMHPLKGGKYVLELAARHPEWRFIIVGFNGGNKLPTNVTAISHIEDKEELSWYYNIASLTLLTSQRETFSMVCAESLACGTPVVGFKAGGPESVFVGDYAKFVEFGNEDALELAVKEMILERREVNTSYIHDRFTYKRMAENYRHCYYSLLKNETTD